MSTHLEIVATASRLGAEVRQLVDSARRVYSDADKVKNIADEVVTGDDWAALAAKLGTSQADAQAAYTMLTAFLAATRVLGYRAFINRLG